MFVKIMDRRASVTRELLYDCKRTSFRPCSIEEDETLTHADIVLDVGELDERCIRVHCPTTEVIYMNDNGKTIDRRVWK